MKIKLLDCTLRDGGYINNWEFSNSNIKKILTSLSISNCEIIECGYLNSKNIKEKDSTLFATPNVFDTLTNELNLGAEKVIMINLGDYDVDKLIPKKKTTIDGIRLAFHKEKLDIALNEAKKIIDLGYKLYFQPMVTKNFNDLEFLTMIEKVNKLNPYAFYVVDSFGSMTIEEFKRYLILSDNNLNQSISLGYHSHNNMQLAFSNAIEMCNSNIKRDIIIDASIYGIGRGAGNLNTELIADYLNTAFSKVYNTLPLLEIIDELLSSMMKKTPWGFSPAQFLSASFNCHPNYATYLINKNTNHIVGVRKVLEKLPQENKFSFNKELVENLYRDSLLETKTEVNRILEFPSDKQILLVASGNSVTEYEEMIEKKRKDVNYILIALNHKPNFECDYYLFSNQKRYDEFNHQLPLNKVVITSNIFSSLKPAIVLDVKPLVYIEELFITNVAAIAINYLISQNISKVEIVGLDGYKIGKDNYNYKETNVITDKNELIEQNKSLSDALKSLSENIIISFLTPSIFKTGEELC